MLHQVFESRESKRRHKAPKTRCVGSLDFFLFCKVDIEGSGYAIQIVALAKRSEGEKFCMRDLGGRLGGRLCERFAWEIWWEICKDRAVERPATS